jgi:UV DNA damage endonuclease
MLQFNIAHNLLFFRITSDLIPFASHKICTYPWQKKYQDLFRQIGDYVCTHHIRISMHPDQFIVLNSKNKDVVERSISELHYHAEVLDLMDLDKTAKIQLHVGGVYNEKQNSINRFIKQYLSLEEQITERLVIENDDKNYTINDCYNIHQQTGIPILFDSFHHHLFHHEDYTKPPFSKIMRTWKNIDGLPMVDYSSQKTDGKPGSHAETINLKDFQSFIMRTYPYDFDIMLEIKDKEHSAIQALSIIQNDMRFFQTNKMELIT